MRSDRGAQGEEDTLCDDALAEILSRLPAVSVLRCRAVCKRWRRITTDCSFLAAHAARRPREMISLSFGRVSAVPLSPDLDPWDDGRTLCDPTIYDRDGGCTASCIFLASLDGLLVLQQRPGLYIICNPITRQWTNLPVLACVTVFSCGFYFHSSSGEYRHLCHGEVDGDGWKDYYYTLSAGAAQPRRLGRAPADDRPVKTGYQYPVSHRGVLYWFYGHPQGTRTGKMLAFDTASETFRLMSRPPCDRFLPLLELDGELCAVDAHCATLLDIWVLQHHHGERWTLRHRVVVPPPRCLLWVCMAISAGGGAILMGHDFPSTRKARMCDIRENGVSKEMDLPYTPMFIVFRESMVSHAFFESPRCPELAISDMKFVENY